MMGKTRGVTVPISWGKAAPYYSLLVLMAILLRLGCLELREVSGSEVSLDSQTFSPALPGYVFVFPRDHGNHPEFQTEWWYFTGHVSGQNGRQLGYELTFFRRGIGSLHVWKNPSAWSMRHLYFAHFAITDEETTQFLYAEKISRAGIARAGSHPKVLDVWIDRWGVKAVDPEHQTFHLFAQAQQFAIDLILEPKKPPVIHGEHGVSVKGPKKGQGSHYYSMTRLHTTGSVSLPTTSLSVKGMSWMDHEFGSGDLAEELVGWDWFSLQLDNQHEIMAYGLRKNDGSFDQASSGTLVRPDGSPQFLSWPELHITVQKHWTSPISGARYPHHWLFSLPDEEVELTLTPTVANQELVTNKSTNVTYWEGAVKIRGHWKGQPIQGRGYVELTGYSKPYHPH